MPASKSAKDKKAAAFVESCMMDMSTAWPDVVSEIMSMLTHGWSYHEVVYKRRQGDNRDLSKRSKHDDGKIGWRKMPIRRRTLRALGV